jgi:hypothetical protein
METLGTFVPQSASWSFMPIFLQTLQKNSSMEEKFKKIATLEAITFFVVN